MRDFAGLKAGDRVTLHMPMSAELPITMLACARLGVIHSEVFGGFSGRASADRIVNSQSRANPAAKPAGFRIWIGRLLEI